MQILPALLLLSACTLVNAQTTRSEQDALALTRGTNCGRCNSALEKASCVAGLSGMKAVSTLDDNVFNTKRARLKKLRSECDEAIKRAAG